MNEHEPVRLDEIATRAVDAVVDVDVDSCGCEVCRSSERMFLETASHLADGTATAPPFDLRNRVLEAASRARPPASEQRNRSTAVDTYDTAVRRLNNLVDKVDPELLERSATDTWSVRELFIHLTVVDHLALQALDGRSSKATPSDVQRLTEEAIANAGVEPGTSRSVWFLQSRAFVDLARTTPVRTVTYLGMPVPSEIVVGDRAFETWLHAQDVRRAFGYELEPPPAADLHLLCDLAARLLPSISTTVAVGRPGNVRIVLDGDGGGTWIVPVGNVNPTDDPIATMRLDPIEFCLLVGNRLDPDQVQTDVRGDMEISRLLLESAPALSRI